MAKETLYIDADEDITTVIGKVTSAKESVVAIVLPKKAPVFQSTVNMKLVKRAAKEAKKSIVLITSEPALTAVAATAGVHIASSLSSKPAVPKQKNQDNETTIESTEFDVAAGAAVAGGAAAAAAATNSAESSPDAAAEAITIDDDQPIELDNTDEKKMSDPADSKKKEKKNKFKIPDFTSFKVRMGLGLLAVILLVTGWVFAFVILPEATVTIETDTRRIDYSTVFTVDTAQQAADFENAILPAGAAEISKEDRATVEATGQKNDGEKATGSVTLTNCRQGAAGVTIPAGTGFSAEGNTYVTNQIVELGPAVYVGDNCISADLPDFGAVKDVNVTANEPGEEFNISAQSLQSPTSGVTAFGSDMTGGTTKNITVVSREDIARAEEQVSGAAIADATSELQEALIADGWQPLNETLQESDAEIDTSASVDEETDEVTVTRTVTFSMLGVAQEDLQQLADSTIQQELADDSSQNIRDNGLEAATYQLIDADANSAGSQTISLQSVATIGQVFDTALIAQEVAGMRRGDIESMLQSREGVREASVTYSPLWVTTTPKNADKITVIINEVE